MNRLQIGHRVRERKRTGPEDLAPFAEPLCWVRLVEVPSTSGAEGIHGLSSTASAEISAPSSRRFTTFKVAISTSMASRTSCTRDLISLVCSSVRSAMTDSVCHLHLYCNLNLGGEPDPSRGKEEAELPHLSLDVREPRNRKETGPLVRSA